MAKTQRDAIIGLLRELLLAYDPSLDVSEGSELSNRVLNPLSASLGSDIFDTDLRKFLQDRMSQEYPSLGVTDGEQINDLLINTLAVLLEPLKREIESIRRNRSLRNAEEMTLEDVENLAANFFVQRNIGSRVRGQARIYFDQPVTVAVSTTATSFSTTEGLVFYPTQARRFSAEEVLLQRSGSQYYVDVPVVAEQNGSEYRITAGKINRVRGIANYSRVTNLDDFVEGGASDETKEEFVARTQRSLTERSLSQRRGIRARLGEEFPDVRNISVIGHGDAEMQRDVLTGGGHGRVRASGVCFLVGSFCLMFSTYEDRGLSGEERIQIGDEIDLNFWNFLFGATPDKAHQIFTILDVVFDSRDIITENTPSIVLLRLSGTPVMEVPSVATLPGVLPGVFSVVRTKGILEISDVPGGITEPDTAQGTLIIDENEVHIGGAYDVWVQPRSADVSTATLGEVATEETLLSGIDLYTCGGSTLRNIVHRKYTVTVTPTSGTLVVNEEIRNPTVDGEFSSARILSKSGNVLVLGELTGLFEAGQTLTGQTSGATATVQSVTASSFGDTVRAGDSLVIQTGGDAGVYHIGKVAGELVYLSSSLRLSERDLLFKVVSSVSVDLVSPRKLLFPFGNTLANDLATTIGVSTVRTETDLRLFGVAEGDTLRILSGNNQGDYVIAGFSSSGKRPILSRSMVSTDSDLSFEVFRSGQGVQRPFVRILPDGAQLLDQDGSDSGIRIPYALPVDSRAQEGFSGAGVTASGYNGFVLPDPGTAWLPEDNLVADREVFSEANSCYSDECLECEDGYIAVLTLTDDGKFWLDSGIPTEAQTFLQSLRSWIESIVTSFGLDADIVAFLDSFRPVRIGEPDTSTSNIIWQAEICLPNELFDGRNNVFVGIPDFDFEAMLDSAASFSDAADLWNNGDLREGLPALSKAKPGDILTIASGMNAGSYRINRVFSYKLGHAGAIEEGAANANLFYDVTLVTIDDEFPHPVLSGLSDFFSSGVPTLSVPAPPSFSDVVITDATTGGAVSPWEVVLRLISWGFKWLYSMGFDLPNGITLSPSETLKEVWKNFFSEYDVGSPTGKQTIRMYFQEPTSVTLFAPQPSQVVQWAAPVGTAASITGETFTLPLGDLEGKTFELTVTGLGGPQTLTATADSDLDAISTTSALASALQDLLDPEGLYVRFSASGSTATGTLTITSIEKGVDVKIYAQATDIDDGFRSLGFHNTSGKKWAERVKAVSTVDYVAGRVTISGTSKIGIRVNDASPVVGDVQLTNGTDLSFIDIAADLQTLIQDKLVDLGFSDAEVDCQFVASGSDYVMRVEVTNGTGIDDFQITAPSAGSDVSTTIFGSPLSDHDATLNMVFVGGVPAGYFIRDFELTVNSTTWSTDLTYEEAVAVDEAAAELETGYGVDAEAGDALAVLMNNDPQFHSPSGTRLVWFVGGTGFRVRTVGGGTTTSLSLTAASSSHGFYRVRMPSGSVAGTNSGENSDGEGTSTPGSTQVLVSTYDPPTLFAAVIGGDTLNFTVDSSAEWVLLPPQDSDGPVSATNLPRDLLVGSQYTGALSTACRFSDADQASAFALGVTAGTDFLHLHEQRILLPLTAPSYLTGPTSDRVVGVKTVANSNVVTLPDLASPSFTFIQSATGLDRDEIQKGDLLFIEEGEDKGGFVVVERTATTLVLDRALTTGTETILRNGKDLTVTEATALVTSATAVFTSADEGRYLTIWGSNHEGVIGSFEIINVNSGTEVELDRTDFVYTETGLYWAICAAPNSVPASEVNGATALIGVRPVRIYNGDASIWRVVDVGVSPDRDKSQIAVLNTNEKSFHTSTEPYRGVRQPFKIVRPGALRVSSSAMNGQGDDKGLFYADVPAFSLSCSPLANVARNTRFEPVFGTFKSDGYYLEVQDSRFTFSSSENVQMVVSPFILPLGVQDTPENLIAIERKSIRLVYEYSKTVANINRFLLSDENRNLCASPLARHFLPSYVYLTVEVEHNGKTSEVAEALRLYIEGLNPEDPLNVSQLERILSKGGIRRWRHPFELVTLTHDLDRRIIGSRSEDEIGDATLDANASNRTTFFIPGPDRSRIVEDRETPIGERTRLVRTLSVAGLGNALR